MAREYIPPTIDWVREHVEAYEGSGGAANTTLRCRGGPAFSTRASSITPAVPSASSLAPGRTVRPSLSGSPRACSRRGSSTSS